MNDYDIEFIPEDVTITPEGDLICETMKIILNVKFDMTVNKVCVVLHEK